jgi:hypothetical protein
MPYITTSELTTALGPQTALALFDDDDSGTLNAFAVAQVIMRAHARVTGSLVSIYGRSKVPPGLPDGYVDGQPQTVPDILRDYELEQAMVFAYDRRPGFVRGQGELTVKDRDARLQTLVEQIRTSEVQLTDDAPDEEPANLGGLVLDLGQHVAIGRNPYGGFNRGDF